MSTPTTRHGGQAVGEWTVDRLEAYVGNKSPNLGRLSEAINAALNTAVALGQQIIKLEDQLAAAVEALRQIREWHERGTRTWAFADAALAKIGGKDVQS